MGHTRNRLLRSREVLEEYLSGENLCRKGESLSGLQRRIYAEALELWTFVLQDYELLLLSGGLLRELDPVTVGLRESASRRWYLSITARDLMLVVSCLKFTDNLMLQSVADVGITWTSFKQTCEDNFGDDWEPIMGPISGWISQYLLDKTKREYFRSAHGAMSFITRLNLPNLVDLQEEARATYLQQELEIATRESGENPYISEEIEILSSWLPLSMRGELYKNFSPHHGPGAVADIDGPKTLERKYRKLGKDTRIRYLDCQIRQFNDTRCVDYPGIEEHPTGSSEIPTARDGNPKGPVSYPGIDRCSNVVFVPKQIDKLRTICEEPTTLMYYQEGIMTSLVGYLHSHKELGRRIRLDKQELSVDMARKGSLRGYYATLDLSNASDSNTWMLVKTWFKRTGIYEALLCTRSNEFKLADGTRAKTHKFAAMGSALCFPIECLVFAAIVWAAILEEGGRPHLSNFRVYGDDIIVEWKYALAVIRRLERFGFKVNLKKSFWVRSDFNFRESCGGEFLDGYNVAPLRLSRRYVGHHIEESATPSQIEACIELANELYFAGLHLARHQVVHQLLKLGERCPVFSNDVNRGIFTPGMATNWRAKRRWNPRLQRLEIQGGQTKTVQTLERKPEESEANYRLRNQQSQERIDKIRRSSESIRLYEWLRLNHLRQPEVRTFGLKVISINNCEMTIPTRAAVLCEIQSPAIVEIVPQGRRVWRKSYTDAAALNYEKFVVERP